MCSGLGGTASYWKPNIGSLSSRFTLYLMDQRGTGSSSRVPVESIEQMSADVVAMLDSENIGQAHFLGHSTGAAIGVATALDYGDRLKSLVIYSSTTRGDSYRRNIFDLRKKILANMGPQAYAQFTSILLYPPFWHNSHDADLKELESRADISLGNADVQGSRFQAILNFDRRRELQNIRIPVLVMCANDDILTPRYFSEEFADLIPGCKTRWFERGGHALSQTMTEEFNQDVIDFMESAERGKTAR